MPRGSNNIDKFQTNDFFSRTAGVGSLCNLTSGYPCFGGYRTCYNTTTGQLIACSDGLGCHTPCDNIPGCEDQSDENVCCKYSSVRLKSCNDMHDK